MKNRVGVRSGGALVLGQARLGRRGGGGGVFGATFYSTRAESRAMTATPLNMSRICRRDCLGERKRRNKKSDASVGDIKGKLHTIHLVLFFLQPHQCDDSN